MTTALALLFAVAAGIAGVAWWRTRRELQRARPEQQRERHELERTRAVAAERERIYRDLHDDIGGKLLSLVYTAEKPEHADLARSVLQDLRDVVSRSRGEPGSLQEVLADIRAECEQRLGALDVSLDWQQDELPDPQMDHGHALHLHRIVREALTNALRHARPGHVRIRVRALAGQLVLDVTDDGGGTAAASVGSGRGTSGMRERAAELQGSIHWDPGTQGGTKVVLQFPLPAGPGQ